MESTKILITELEKLLNGGGAHAGFEEAVSDIPFEKLGERPYGLPYSIWQLVDHIRIAQWDMLRFSIDSNHISPKWPEEYWTKNPVPNDEQQWIDCLQQVKEDLKHFIALLRTEDLFTKIPSGSGQSILTEALQIADHNAYHIAEIIVLRRLLGIWKP